ncbi:MAG: hypothetical protein CMI25_02555 [Opitutae bacterium]|nr:hypothetical protein [Opitutae bacterium]
MGKSLSIFSLISLLFSCLQLAGEGKQTVSFNRDIRPILSSKCFHCHGPSDKFRKAKLRLDLEESALSERDGIRAIVPGSLDESELWHRILSDDPEEMMPPPESKKPMSKEEISLFKTWIAEGAKWEDHWSFSAIKEPALPEVSNPDWIRNPIDRFVLRNLDKRGLKPSPEADRRTLARRLFLDLTGLPPSPAEVKGFLDDKSPDALERLVDRLLSSDGYAERMTLVWMDAARYGDTSVFHDDGPRTMWPWRDWVLNAYKNNMPFDQFTIEQLAGDLLPESTVDQKIASGFNRNHATTDEGGVIAEEFRVEYVVDRVKTTANVWMGLTMECAQCHSHMYDPISQEEYYSFYAFYNNNADPGMQTRRGNQAPVVNVESSDQKKKKAELEKKNGEISKKQDARRKVAQKSFDEWTEEQFLNAGEKKTPVAPSGLVSHLPLDIFEKNLTPDIARNTTDCRLHGKAKPIGNAKFNGGLKIEGNGFVELKGFKDPTWNKPFSYGCWVKTSNGNQNGAVFAKMDEGNAFRGFDLWLQNGKPGAHIIHKWQDNAVKVVGKKKIAAKKWQHVFITYDGSGRAAGTRVYLNGEKLDHTVEADGLTATIATDKPLRLGRRFSTSITNGVEIDDVRFYDRELTSIEVQSLFGSDLITPLLALAASDRTPEQTKTLFDHYLNSIDKPYQALAREKDKINGELASLGKTKITSMIMADNPANKMRKTYLLMRGQYSSPDKSKEFTPDTPGFLPPMKEDLPKTRLGLAKWIVDPQHPLTARVAANRHWQTIFGRGLTNTPSDFGSQGNWPTHPDLINWLAADFRKNGWNVKRAIKQMVTSATYRQSSVTRPEHLEKDPVNLYHARAPRFRMMGEFVRDNALAISGLLQRDFGGSGVKPYQPPGLWVEVSLSGGRKFIRDKGEKLYRRSMYTYWKRSAPQPALMAFDTPTREVCVLQRQRTNTPMQALVTLNDDQFVEAARRFARRILSSGKKTFPDKLNFAFEWATGRPADQLRIDVLKEFYDEQSKVFKDDPKRADELLSVGESPRDEKLDPYDHAAWTLLASIILNLDETLNRE